MAGDLNRTVGAAQGSQGSTPALMFVDGLLTVSGP